MCNYTNLLTMPMFDRVNVPPDISASPSCPLDPFSWRVFSSRAMSSIVLFCTFWKQRTKLRWDPKEKSDKMVKN